MSNINLCEKLKKYIGVFYYSPLLGYLQLKSVEHNKLKLKYKDSYVYINSDGTDNDGNMALFPSKETRDWENYLQLRISPKTWDEFCYYGDRKVKRFIAQWFMNDNIPYTDGNTPIEKSALALMKIWHLIQECYGGNENAIFYIDYSFNKYNKLYFNVTTKNKLPFGFKTQELAITFLNYSENLELLEDFFMIK